MLQPYPLGGFSPAAAAELNVAYGVGGGGMTKATADGTYPARPSGTTTVAAPIPEFNILDQGAVPDGVTDCSTAIQKADTACKIHEFFTGIGGTVVWPEGNAVKIA